ncbi:propionyl-CoA synthetase [Candidatus Rariloculus sp.]|uniref:propionyl-CoA synthetase n=1 Tax=Candidatus Rariloculus sp. TaxID=3101265 RepID=UPI003D13B205
MADGYAQAYERSLNDPERFWAEAARDIDWIEPWQRVLDDSNAPLYRWFSGAELNTCYNCLDRHVARGLADQPALIYDSTMTGQCRTYSYAELLDLTARFAGSLEQAGVGKGDRVIIYMPMVPETVVAMLASARLGAVHSVVFGGFAAAELATRIDDAKPRVIVSASCGLEPGRVVAYKPLLDAAIGMASHKPARCIILQRPELAADLGPGDADWHEALAAAEPRDCVPVAATDPLYILYTSGTTGQPKGIVRDNGGHAVALHWTMQAIYGIEAGDVYWAASDVGWVVGHSYIVYAPLLKGATTVLFEGKPVGTPDAGTFWRVIERHRVKVMFTAPTALRAIRRDDPEGKFIAASDLNSLEAMFLAGERSDPETLNWASAHLGIPVIDHWWQTETGWPITANPCGLGLFDIRPGSANKPVPGWDVRVLGDDGEAVAAERIGAISCKLPLPPGTLPTLWNADQRFREAYLETFPGFYSTGDAGYIDAGGYVHVLTRTDDIINVAGHRLSTGAIEEVLASHPDIAECAVTGISDAIKGQIPLGFLCRKSGHERAEADIVREVVELVRERIGPVAAFKQAIIVERLPKTRSGKILRGILRSMADGNEYAMPATIDDPAILDEIAATLRTHGYPAD